MKKKKSKILKIGIILVGICLFILLFPMPYSVKDGGSFGISSLFGIYEIQRCHEAYGNGTEIDGVHYSYSPSTIRFKVGTQVTLFGLTVFDNTHFESDYVEPIKYEEDIRDLISYCNSHQVDDIELRSISVSERDSRRHIGLAFLDVSELEKSDEIVKMVKAYLNEKPDSFLYDGFELTVAGRYNEETKESDTTTSIKPYEAEYDIDLTDLSISELRLTPWMVPEEVPSYDSFEEVKTIKNHIFSFDEDQEKVLREIYPDAEFVSK